MQEINLITTDQLSELLDRQNSQVIEAAARLTEKSPSKDILSRLLQPQSIVSIATSPISTNHDILNLSIGYRKIGFGQCGLVFSKPGTTTVVKISRPYFHEGLWNDFLCHLRIYRAFTRQTIQPACRLPLVYSFVSKTDTTWWDANKALFLERSSEFPLPSMGLVSQRIPQLPRVIRHAIIDLYCPEILKEHVKSNPINRDCLVRIYLGRRRNSNAPPPPNFALRNYNLHLDQMINLDLPVKEYATAIAEALALIHWAAHVDAYDVEFVLGGEVASAHTQQTTDLLSQQLHVLEHIEPGFANTILLQQRTSRIWVLDFNLCSRWSEEALLERPEDVINQLVLAFFENDPYYPLPEMDSDENKELWFTFSQEYLRRANEVLLQSVHYKETQHLPGLFIKQCIERERKNLAQGLGHGHRDFKG
ncbi:zinc finger domain-containing protein [Trichoderma chlorosporum]